jgi:hypothetical protein
MVHHRCISACRLQLQDNNNFINCCWVDWWSSVCFLPRFASSVVFYLHLMPGPDMSGRLCFLPRFACMECCVTCNWCQGRTCLIAYCSTSNLLLLLLRNKHLLASAQIWTFPSWEELLSSVLPFALSYAFWKRGASMVMSSRYDHMSLMVRACWLTSAHEKKKCVSICGHSLSSIFASRILYCSSVSCVCAGT